LFSKAYEKYSASVEAIRKQSLALGNIALEDADRNEGVLEFQASPPLSDSVGSQIQYTSNLSLLLQHANSQESPSTLPEVVEDTPLLRSRSHSDTTYHTIAVDSESTDNVQSPPQMRLPPAMNKSPRRDARESVYHGSRVWDQGVKRMKMMHAKDIWREVVMVPVGYIPAVILGLLLNLLDAISYGMWHFLIYYVKEIFPRLVSRH
jgi:hypothetical protein